MWCTFSLQNEKDSHYCPTMSIKVTTPPSCIESSNILWKLIFKYPKKDGIGNQSLKLLYHLGCRECLLNIKNIFKFSWEDISKNPNLTPEFIKKHPYNRWSWERISINKSFTLNDVKKMQNFHGILIFLS